MISKIFALIALVGLTSAVPLFHSGISHQQLVKHDGHHHIIPIHHEILHHAPIHHLGLAHHGAGAGFGHIEHHHDAYTIPNYHFAYSVADPHTGDHKSQHETRHADHVKGGYELVEPDGNVRKVEYTADDHTGFNAIVHHSSPHHHVHVHHGHHGLHHGLHHL